MKFWYELTDEDKSRRKYIEKKKRLDATYDFINRLSHRTITILLEILIYMKKETKQNATVFVAVATIFTIGFLLGSDYFNYAPWVFIAGLVLLLIISRVEEKN